MKSLDMIPLFSRLPTDVKNEFSDYEIPTHRTDSVNVFDWDDLDWLPVFKAWVAKTYGLDASHGHEYFAVCG
jgi:hypothetical protein